MRGGRSTVANGGAGSATLSARTPSEHIAGISASRHEPAISHATVSRAGCVLRSARVPSATRRVAIARLTAFATPRDRDGSRSVDGSRADLARLAGSRSRPKVVHPIRAGWLDRGVAAPQHVIDEPARQEGAQRAAISVAESDVTQWKAAGGARAITHDRPHGPRCPRQESNLRTRFRK